MTIELTFTPESYAEFMNLDLDYVKENWESIYERLVQEANNILINIWEEENLVTL